MGGLRSRKLLLLLAVFTFTLQNCAFGDILGFTKQGSLKLKTECSPTTGYYFIPLENKGDFVLKISPPEGWTFEPQEVAIAFDGETDQCSRGEDVNFDFKGFSVIGKVTTAGFHDGPKGVKLLLKSEKLELSTLTEEGGMFRFDMIPQGKYSIIGSHALLHFEKNSYVFEMKENVKLENQIVVTGYELSGGVNSDGNPVEKVTIVLISNDATVKSPKNCKTSAKELNLPAAVTGSVLCVENTDKQGKFKFTNLSPGKYVVVPVYKGANIVYNVNPDRMEVILGHDSLHLKESFEVMGFTVQGRVKGHSGAQILVNGELKATSGHDGSFTIPKMKPGTYEFEVIADKFLFDKKRLTIQPTNPILADFVPTKFETCGSVSLKSKTAPEITLSFKGSDGFLFKEKISDVNQACIYLPQGTFTVWLESNPAKYFLPEKTTLVVPSGSRFSFQEFSGSISGSVVCKFSSCEGLRIRAENKGTGSSVQEKALPADGKFKFEDLESGDYQLLVEENKYCWSADKIEKIQLKNSNIENVNFLQTGVPLEIRSSHATKVLVSGKNPATNIVLNLKAGIVEKFCVTDTPSSYKVIPTPEDCHQFESKEYTFKPGERLELIAKKHKHGWTIVSPSKIQDLKLTRDGISHTIEEIQKGVDTSTGIEIKETVAGNSVTYEIVSMEEPGGSVEWLVFSYGFIFEPTKFNVDALFDCQSNLLQVVAKKSHVIKGKLVPPVEGVDIKIELLGDPEGVPAIHVATNHDGEYIAGPFVHPSGFKVTPSYTGCIFKPLDSDPYSFTVYQLAKIYVKVESGSGSPVAGVLLSLSGPNSYRLNKATDANGEMTFGELQPGQYYLKALLKEFLFQPSAINIDLKEQETNRVQLQAIRESFSVHGQLTSLSGELMPNLLLVAKGVGNCSEYGEEGSSDDIGNFRIWALKSYCNYQVEVVKQGDFSSKVERTIPEVLDVKIGTQDIHNISFVVITPVRRMDVSLRCHTNNEQSLDHLKAVVYSAKDPNVPIHSTPFNGISYIILPPIPKDDQPYTISFECSLNKYQYKFTLPDDINFTAKSAYAHFSFDFNIAPAPVDQEIGKNSYIAFAIVLAVVVAIANYEKIIAYGKELMETYYSGATGGVAKKSKSKTK